MSGAYIMLFGMIFLGIMGAVNVVLLRILLENRSLMKLAKK